VTAKTGTISSYIPKAPINEHLMDNFIPLMYI